MTFELYTPPQQTSIFLTGDMVRLVDWCHMVGELGELGQVNGQMVGKILCCAKLAVSAYNIAA